MGKEVRVILRNMTLINVSLFVVLSPVAFYMGGVAVALGLLVGLVLSLGNFYGSIYSFVFAFRNKKEKGFSFGKASGLILVGFWVRLAVLGAILFFLARISELSMFAALLAFVVFYGILFVSEMRLLSRSAKEFSNM